MNKKIIGGVIAGIAVVSAVAYTIFDYKTTVYQCGKCRTLHKPGVKAWICGPYTPGKKLLKCPRCEDRNWHDRFVVANENDFI